MLGNKFYNLKRDPNEKTNTNKLYDRTEKKLEHRL